LLDQNSKISSISNNYSKNNTNKNGHSNDVLELKETQEKDDDFDLPPDVVFET